MTPELKALVDEQAATFEAFQQSCDEMAEQIKKLGSADVVTDGKVDKINGSITELQTKIDEANRKAEAADKAREAIVAGYDAQLKEAGERLDTLETKYARRGNLTAEDEDLTIKACAVFWNVPKHRENAAKLGVEMTREVYDDYMKAFATYLRHGDEALGLEKKVLQVGSDADGGYWVQPQMMDALVTRQFETSPMRSICSVMTTSTDAVEWITDTNDATLGGWVGEQESRSATTTPQIGKIRIPVHEQYANPGITQKMLDDSAFDVEGWLARKIGDKLGRTENTAFVTGNGVNQPRGFTDYSGAAVTTADSSRSWGVLQYRFTGASAAFYTATVDATSSPADELVDVMADLKPIYRANARWVMARTTEALVRKLKATTSEYVVTINTGNIQGTPLGSFMLLGFPIVDAEDMPVVAANSYSIAFGDFREGYQIVDRIGVRVLRDPYTNKPNVQFYTTKRVGGDVTNFDAIKLLKFGTS